MTKIITRYFADVATARKTQRELVYQHRFSTRILFLFDKADGLAEALTKHSVDPGAASAYAAQMASGGAVLLVRAAYKPLGVAQTFREVTAAMRAADMGDVVQEVEVKDERLGLSVMQDHPHMMTRPLDGNLGSGRMADWPFPLISRRKPFDGTVFPRHARMASWPLELLNDRKPNDMMAIPRHGRMANFPIPLLSDRKPFTGSVIGRHQRMANFPIPLISRRKPRNRSIFPRHQRMATVPFPLLLNGKTGQNALVPGHKRMANFPISLLSDRKPYTGSAIGRHQRMANFPIGLLSSRKPFTGSAIPRHGRMADMILPLIARGSNGKGWSLSKALGIPLLTKR